MRGANNPLMFVEIFTQFKCITTKMSKSTDNFKKDVAENKTRNCIAYKKLDSVINVNDGIC